MDAMQCKLVLVIGANGKTGFRVIQLLQQSGTYEPVAMVREASQQERFDALGAIQCPCGCVVILLVSFF